MRLVISGFFLLLSACGTGTGNPGVLPSNVASAPANLTSLLVVENLCGVFAKCSSDFDRPGCLVKIQKETNFGPRLGLGPANSESLTDIVSGELTGRYQVNRSAMLTCADNIQILTCDSSVIVNGYQPDQADPWARSAEALGPECAGSLSEK